jgi:hypothetical protein
MSFLAGFVNVGTVAKAPPPRSPSRMADLFSVWQPVQADQGTEERKRRVLDNEGSAPLPTGQRSMQQMHHSTSKESG